MQTIPLTRGLVALIDDADFELLQRWKWLAAPGSSGNFYARRLVGDRAMGAHWVHMHRLLLNAPPGLQVDHIDGNGLNNQRTNLRLCTTGENRRNQLRRRRGTHSSRFKGVTWDSPRQQWVAQIHLNGRHIFLGRFATEDEAAAAYARGSRRFHGAFAAPVTTQDRLT